MQLKGKKVLVTGACGFIGSHLVEELVRYGCDVRALVMYNSFNSRGWLDSSGADIREAVDFFAGDIRDSHGVRLAVKGCDVVLHLAALIAIPYSYILPETYVDTNVKGTLNVLQAARECEVEKVVHTSTSEVYGTAQYVPIDENHPLQGQSPYSASKIGADQMAFAFHASHGTPVATLRPFNTYGPRQSARAVIPTIITQIAAGQRSIRLGSVHPTRDFNYVLDVVRAFMAVAEADATVGQVVNAGSDFEISIGDLAQTIARAMGVDIEIQTDEQRIRPAKSEVERLWASNAKIRELTGWTPEHGGLEGFVRGIGKTVDWFSNPANLALYKWDVYNI